MEYKDYVDHWAYNKQTDKKTLSELEQADLLLKELAILDCMKSLSISNQDKGMFDAISNDQYNCMKQYSRLVDDAAETGLNNYLEESLEHASGDNAEELDTRAWTCSLSADDPKLQSLLKEENSQVTWLTRDELGFADVTFGGSKSHSGSSKRPRISPPRQEKCSFGELKAPVGVEMAPRSIAKHQEGNSISTEDKKGPREVPQFGNESRLPDRLKNRIYPGKHSNERLESMRNREKKSDQGAPQNPFQSATSKYVADCSKQGKAIDPSIKKSLGGKPSKGYKPPVATGDKEEAEEEEDERMRGVDKKLAKLIMNEIMDKGLKISWSDISGLEFAKKTIKEIVVWPMLRPDIFTGLRGPPKGVLLFGPPGTGKTLIGKCIASQSKSTFFSISASSLTSKWIGEGEKLVRALFAVARCNQPAVIFIDEIDSLLSQRSESEHESSRRIKTEFLIQLDGVACEAEERLLIVGATNRPQEIDEAARRRLVKRLYIPLPDTPARMDILQKLLKQVNNSLTDGDAQTVAELTHGYSGADMSSLCRDAALAPIRSIDDIENIDPNEVRPLNFEDLLESTKRVRPSVKESELELYVRWNEQFGSGL